MSVLAPQLLAALQHADWAALLEPIPGPDECGVSLRYEGTFDRIRRARQCDDESLSQGVWETQPKKADWAEVAALCADALCHQSKDLQLGAWLLEAWIHLHGFSGAASGLALIHGLCDRFGPLLHPRSDEGDAEVRFAAIAWVNEKLPTDLKLAALTAPASGQPSSWADWESAQRLVQVVARSREFEAEAAAARLAFHKSVLETPTHWLSGRRRELRAIIDRALAIDQLIEAAAGPDSPCLAGLRKVAEAIDAFLAGVLGKRDSSASPDASAATDAGVAAIPFETAAQPAQLSPARGWPSIRTRTDAYRQLSEIAAFLSATEPHSPVPYLLERAVAWGSMSLTDLLPELVRDRENLSEIHRLLRMDPAHTRVSGVSG